MRPEPKIRAAWERPALCAVLALSAFLNCWALSINGWANTYYSAAVLGMTRSWKAFFFGALDAGSFITVDKPPLALWVQALSARVFGLHAWSLLLPQAVAGALTVGVVHHVVRRGFGPLAATVAAISLAVTPIAVVMARHNNPDALLALLLALALWAASNAVRSGRLAPLLWCAVAVGLAFNTKMLQAYLVLPVIGVVYLVTAAPRLPRRLLGLAAATATLLLVSLSWMTVVDLLPAASRPHVGGSTDNTVWDLAVGYNGLGRVGGQAQVMSPGMMPGGGAGHPPGPGPGGPPGAGMHDGGWTRLLTGEVAPQIAWLFPLAVFGAVAVLLHLRGRPRQDPQRADFLLWAGTLLVTAVVFSTASGIWHPYYTVALAAPLAAVVGMGVTAMLRLAREGWWGLLLPVSIAVTGAWCYHLLDETPDFVPWLGPTVVALTAVALIATANPLTRRPRVVAAGTALGVVAVLAGPTAYALTPLSTPVAATFPAAGPARTAAHRPPPHGPPGPGRRFREGPRDETIGPALTRYLVEHHRNETWLVAVVGSMVAAPVILDTGRPVMAVGGYNGDDPAPTVDELRRDVHAGLLRYVWTGGSSGVRGMGGPVDTRVVDESMSWVAHHCAVVPPADYGAAPGSSTQLYDCRGQ
ncbi:ArnT family glycosyltransferase [Saccharopolyspora rosea]|uniref:ArnT family glycosyltransferase n=1 Tax=Saccharopolyspora rosea TaxID=524884 RepID=UPI0021DA64A4|nr:glycosyltransferase family 39 protein [Saccharopolyspora rosea]